MKNTGRTLERTKEIIISACQMLHQAREKAPFFGREAYAPNADCYVLLSDATKLLCEAVSQARGETQTRRWTPALPELLLSHPEKCRETLALVESEHFAGLSHFHFSAA